MNYIAVVEDSAQDRAVLDSYLEKYQQEKNCHFQITHFSDGDEIALGYKGGYDLILMDIEMTFMDGMSAAEEIRRADPEVLIIFITNSPQYAIKGYAVQALDYILKPLSYYAFCQRMNHVRELLGRRQKHFLTVPCAGGVQKLDVSDIYYVEICDHDLLFHTKQGEVHSTGSMRDVEQKLPPENFFRSSKAYLVNLEHVDGIQDEDAIVNGERVQISRLIDDQSTASTMDNPMWDALARRAEVAYPGATLLPQLEIGATDARFFRRMGTVAYGTGLFSANVTYEDMISRFHGHDERIDVESLRLTTNLWLDVVRDLLG